MITIEALEPYGSDVQAGLGRCTGMKDLFLRLVDRKLSDESFGQLESALAAQNIQDAFEAAHALKGAVGNLALTPL